MKEENGVLLEPYESVVIDIDDQHQGAVMEKLGERRGELQDMQPDGKGRVRLDYIVPSRGLIGLQPEFMTMTSGSGLMYRLFDHYGPQTQLAKKRKNGVLIANGPGKTVSFALWNLQERGKMLLGPQVEVYEGMIVGMNMRDNDLVVNVSKAKQLTNMRASGSDEHIVLIPPMKLSLEQALCFINDDELVEITPSSIRLRKRFLKEHERKRSGRG